ncbi:M48 family metallopeptidase [Candidatus Woesearchaeota archaeon]|nr:M48 family metallopeptidase [Candidatus Woesearchaeota archaeon]
MYDEISSNKRKSILLISIFIIVIIILGYLIGFYIGNVILGPIMAFLISIIFILISYFAGDKLILSMSHAKEVNKKDYPHLVNTVEGLSIAAGIPTPKIYTIEDSAINAFASGRSPKHAAVTVTTGAIKRLNREELEGVIGHEMSHIKNYDVRFMMLAVLLVGVITLLSDFILRTFLFSRGGDREGKGGIFVVIILLGLVLAILSPLIAQLLKFAISRKREFLADANGTLLTRNPMGLANALKKIRDDKEPLVEAANKATAALFIENPLRKIGGKINSLFSSHPDVNERIRRLEKM